MQSFDIVRETKPKKSFRVASVMGKYDLRSEHIIEKFKGDIDLDCEWQIGIIVGNSGTGKTTIAKELFKENYIDKFKYKSESVLDDFDKNISVNDICKIFNSVGFSSVVSWLKPYSVLSQGEKMRVDLARSLLDNKELIVFDEFTSVVDRNIAKIGSYAIQKNVKRTAKKFIAVSCHSDIIEWLEPDWVFDTNQMKFKYTRGLLRRPEIKLDIFEIRGYWERFRKYHYLNYDINHASKQYVGFINDIPVCFCGILHFPHPKIKNYKKVTRLVVMPDYQGIGIGNRMLKYIAEYYINKNYRFGIVTSTPALIEHFKNNSKWELKNYGRNNTQTKGSTVGNMKVSKNRLTTSWEYVNS